MMVLKRCYNRLVLFLENRQAIFSLRVLHIIRRILQNPSAVPGKAIRKFKMAIETRRRMSADDRHPSYGDALPGEPRMVFRLPSLDVLQPHAHIYATLAHKTMLHEFDLLGSGWVNLQIGLPREGVELDGGGGVYPARGRAVAKISPRSLAEGLHKANRPKAVKLWGGVDSGYIPISWNEDFKSGWIWPANVSSAMQKYGDKPGADIKVPWELSRMHQLPWLALAAGLSSAGAAGFDDAAGLVQEFQNQVLDFAAACPPRFGANWVCTMDVAIRACNIIAAYDFFRDQGASFRPGFEKELLRILSDHFFHIVNHLEYQPKIRANHYYSDVAGLLILSAWLPKTPEVVSALAWSIEQFFTETVLQFQPDGANFEASTSYHRLCSELMYYALAVIRGLDRKTLDLLRTADSSAWRGKGYYEIPPLRRPPEQDGRGVIIPDAVLSRAWLAPEFSLACRMEPGEIIQIGDNDSGRLFKFLPALNREDFLEIINDHSHILALAWGVTGKPGLEEWGSLPDSAIARLITDAAQPGILCPPAGEPAAPPGSGEPDNREGANRGWKVFPDFGLYFKKHNDDIIAVRCGHNGQYDNGGHAHNDQLSIALARAGLLFIVDPGTYLYTPVPAWRNRMRGTCRHNTLFLSDKEQNDFTSISLFTLNNQAFPEVSAISDDCLCAGHYGFGQRHERRIVFTDKIEITDRIAAQEARIALHCHPGVVVREMAGAACVLERDGVSLKINFTNRTTGAWEIEDFIYSAGYGLKQPALRLVSPPFSDMMKWEIV